MPTNSAVEAGRAVLRVVAVEEGVRGTLNEIEGQLEETARRVRNVGLAITATGIAGLGVLTASLNEASRAEEIASKFAQVFGPATDEMRQFFREMADRLKRSEVDLQEFGAGFQDLLKPIGFDDASAREFSAKLTELAIDLASFNNRSDTDAVRDLQAALTGSSETVKRYGVIANETAVKQELLNQGIKAAEATDVDKVYARIAIILRQTTAAQGDATRTAGSFANQLKETASVVQGISVAVGNSLLPVIQPLVTAFNFLARQGRNVAEEFPILVRVAAGLAVTFTAVGVALTAAGVAAGLVLSPITLLSIALFVTGTSLTQLVVKLGASTLSLLTFAGAARAAGVALGFLGTAARLFVSTPIGLLITVAAVALPLLAGGFALAASGARDAAQANREFAQSVEGVVESSEELAALQQLANQTSLTSEEMKEAEAILNSLGRKYDNLGIIVDQDSGKIIALTGAFERLNDRLKEDALTAKNRELQEGLERIATLETALENVFKPGSGGRGRSQRIARLTQQLEEARAKAAELREEIQNLRGGGETGPTAAEAREIESFNSQQNQRLRDEEIAGIEDARQRRLAQAEEIAAREIAKAEELGAETILIEQRLALEKERINREFDERQAKEAQREAKRAAREAKDLQRQAEGFANDRINSELRLRLKGRELELALLDQQEKEKIQRARENGQATLDIEREFANKRALVNRDFDKKEREEEERKTKRANKERLRVANALQIQGQLASRAAGQQFTRGSERVAFDSLAELRKQTQLLNRLEKRRGGIPVG